MDTKREGSYDSRSTAALECRRDSVSVLRFDFCEERKLTRTENAIVSEKNPKEREKTNLLLDLAERGILGYFRLVAERHG